MAILSPSKLLGGSKVDIVSKKIQVKNLYNQERISGIKNSLLDIEKLAKTILQQDQTSQTNRANTDQRKENEERETRLETPQENKRFRLPRIPLPGMSFLDRIKRFLFITALGWLFSNLQDKLPQLTGIVQTIGSIYGVVEKVFGFILESVVSFIDRGYQVYDKLRETVKNLGGEGAQQIFDKFSSGLNRYINGILIGGLLLSSAIGGFMSTFGKLRLPARPKISTPKPTAVRTTAPGRPGKPGLPPKPARTPGGRVLQDVLEESAEELGKGAGTKGVLKNLLKTVKGPLGRLPILGSLVEFGISWALGDPVGKAAFRGVGTLLLGAIGSFLGPLGAFFGGWMGAELAGLLYDYLFQNKKGKIGNPQQKHTGGVVIKKYAKGGQIFAGEEGRSITIARKRRDVPPLPEINPGQDVGGKDIIQKLYPDPSRQLKIGTPNPYYALTGAASDFRSAPYGLGALMSGAISVALGQKMGLSTILNAAAGIENMFYDNYDESTGTINVFNLILGSVLSAATAALENVKRQLPRTKSKEEVKPPPADQPASRGPKPQTTSPGGVSVGGLVVGRVGSTGKSTGPHIHIETGDGYGGKGGLIPQTVLDSIIVNGKPLSSYSMGDGLGAGRGHQGFDYPMYGGEPIVLKGGLKFVEYDNVSQTGYGNALIISDGSRKYLIAHLSAGPDDPNAIAEIQKKQQKPGQTVKTPQPLDNTSATKMPEPSAPVGAGNVGSVQKQALNILGKYESDSVGGYNAVNQIGVSGGRGTAGFSGDFRQMKQHKGKALTDMTIGEIMALQAERPGMSNEEWISQGRLHAVGRYQFIGATLPGVVARAGIPVTAKFTPDVQDKLGLQLLKESGIGAWVGPSDRATLSERAIVEQARKAKAGGLISPSNSSPNITPLQTYPSYSQQQTKMMIQPITKIVYKEKQGKKSNTGRGSMSQNNNTLNNTNLALKSR